MGRDRKECLRSRGEESIVEGEGLAGGRGGVSGARVACVRVCTQEYDNRLV